jgi:cytochrome b pre-mRNA-processing protein 3
MLDFLFRRLTTESRRGSDPFNTATKIAREPSWYLAGGVPDTLDGRFATLATVIALALVRLEAEGEEGDRASVAITERFVEVMESEHRELGVGDPTLGRTVRKLVGSLARRTDLWRSAISGEVDWVTATRQSLYKADAESPAVEHSAGALRELWRSLEEASLTEIEEGKFG